jgi:hypothetical protein
MRKLFQLNSINYVNFLSPIKQIQSMADEKYCIDKMNRPKEQPLGYVVIVIANAIHNDFPLSRSLEFTFVVQTRNDHKIISISFCDTIETFQMQTWNHAWIRLVRE